MPVVYGKVDCFTDPDYGTAVTQVSGNTPFAAANELYTGLYSFLQTLQVQSVVDLVAMYTGSGGSGVGYWDQAARFQGGAFSVWRWKSNATRPWDWYMYIHLIGNGATTYSSTTNQIPTRDENGTTINAYDATVLMQAAIGISNNGITSYNPWNGVINTAGAAYKGFPVWTSGSTTNSLFVFPRSNNPTGSNVNAKDKCMTLYHSYNSNIIDINITTNSLSTMRNRYHFISDGNGLAIFQDPIMADASPNTWFNTRKYIATYVGPFTLNDSIVSANSGNLLAGTGSQGFLMFQSTNGGFGQIIGNRLQHTVAEYTNYGNTANSTAVKQGGMLATLDANVRIFQLANDNTYFWTKYSPTKYLQNQIEERPFMILASEWPYIGLVGWLDTPIFRNCIGGNSHDIRTDGLRAIFGGTTEITDRKISTCWSGSNPPGFVMTRDGFSFQYNFNG